MKKILYAIGILMLPLAYAGVQKLNDQPVEWAVLGLMVLILLPLLFWKQIGKIEETFDSMTEEEKGEAVKQAVKRVTKGAGKIG